MPTPFRTSESPKDLLTSLTDTSLPFNVFPFPPKKKLRLQKPRNAKNRQNQSAVICETKTRLFSSSAGEIAYKSAF
jgi:hypothetical protein